MSAATTIIPPVSRLVATDLLELIGNTPLIRLERLAQEFPGVEIYGKAEFFNPGGSVKDRAALNMILDGERTGKLTRDRVILDSTSGNTGIAYAMIAAYRGYKVKLCLPKNASMERKHVLQAYGAEMVFSDPGEGSDGAIRLVREIYKEDPDRYFYPDQYNNPANWKAHYDGTALEILAQTERRHHAFCSVHGDERDVCREFAETAQGNPGSAVHFSAAVHGLSRTGRSEAYADRDCTGNLRSESRR